MLKFEELSFVATDTVDGISKISAWQPSRANDHSIDCQRGREYFRELREFMREGDNTVYLCRVMSAMVSAGVWSGVEIGFTQALSEAAVH